MADVSQLTNAVVGEWTLGHVVGKGADGIVYAATGQCGRRAAVKIFLPESLLQNGVSEAKQRLELQLGLVGSKHHPNLVEIYGGGALPEHKTLFLAMELIPGTSLDKLPGKIPREQVPVLLGQLARAARFLEEKLELFHRDIKPANIVVSDDFTTLTLLDLGVVFRSPDDEGGRLSGPEFVATLRYSPPEFVWRTEEGSEDGAWRAITFYQLGATLHDILAGKPIFYGEDQPRARLYDCVRDRTPEISGDGIEPWLIQLSHACLLKDWRLRLQFVAWESFEGPPVETKVATRERSIRLKQARKEEARIAAAKNPPAMGSNSREQILWQLNSGLFGELRTYLLDSSIFPKFRATEITVSEYEYSSLFEIEDDANKEFSLPWTINIRLMVSTVAREATELRFTVECRGEIVVEAMWTEMFTVESAFSNCQQALLDAVDILLS